MKLEKILTILLTPALLTACYTTYEDEEPLQEREVIVIEREVNAYKIDTPYGMEGLYDETTTPEVYSIVATRAVNKMLDDTRPIYENLGTTFLYIMEPKKMQGDVENGFYLSQRVTKNIIEGSKTYTIVNSMQEADYYLETLISKINIQGQNSPIIQYKLMMFDKSDRKVNEWIETIRQTKNDDRSWL